MDCCSSDCDCSSGTHTGAEIEGAAESLAGLLQQSDEYQEFARFASLIQLDPDVARLLTALRNREQAGADPDELDTLQVELEALPAVQAYRKTEKALKALFHAADETISAAAGVRFAPNAQHSGCG